MVVFSFAVDVLLFWGCLVVFPLLAVSAFAAALVVFSFAVVLFLRSGAAWWSFPLLSTCFCVQGQFDGGPALSHIFLFLLTEFHAAKLQI